MNEILEKIGGPTVIKRLVESFYERIFADPELAPFFRDTDPKTLKKMQQTSFEVALGEPCSQLRSTIYRVHAGRGIERHHLSRFTEHLIETLNEIGISDRDADQVVQKIAMYANEVTGDSNVDG